MPLDLDPRPGSLHFMAAGSGPLVVCLHSSGSSSGQWRSLAASAQERFRFVAFDLHGHGRSPDYRGASYSLQAESEAVLRSLPDSAAPVHLVGHSYGGAVALDLAARHPGRFASVIVFEPVLFALLDSASDEFREITSVGRAIVRAARSGELEAASARFLDYWNGPGTWDSLAADHRARVTARIVPVARHFEALSIPLTLDHWRGLSAPTVVLRGDRSPAPARVASERFATLPAVTIEVLAGLGHMGPVTDPARVNTRVIEHLSSCSALSLAA
jgi:pimeloyl-ACP methyl ester carboxylesterase